MRLAVSSRTKSVRIVTASAAPPETIAARTTLIGQTLLAPRLQHPVWDAANHRESGNRQPVLDIRNAGRRPRRVLNRAALVPIVDLAFENDLVAVLYAHSDCRRLHLRVAL